MLYPSIDEVRKKVDSKYVLVILASKRAREIVDGKPALYSDDENNGEVEVQHLSDLDKPVSQATSEISKGLISYKRLEEVSV